MKDFGTSQSPKSTRLRDNLWCPDTPCGRRWTRQTPAEPNTAHKWLDGVSDVLADFLRRLRETPPLRHYENPPGPPPTGDYQPLLCSPWLAAAVFVTLTTCCSLSQEANSEDILPPPPSGKTWRLLWGDEFQDRELDSNKWEVRKGARRRGYWDPKNVYLSDGDLVIETKFDGEKYTTGGVWSRGRFEHKYGYWIIKVKLPSQEGHWASFWLYADGVKKVGNAGNDGTEIDIMERPRRTMIQHTLHWDGYGSAHQVRKKRVEISGLNGYHYFSQWWTPTEYRFYVEGSETWRTSEGEVSDVPQFIQISDEVGRWAGDIVKARLPDYYKIDYVRVYELVDETSE